jgi:hypothetical protein
MGTAMVTYKIDHGIERDFESATKGDVEVYPQEENHAFRIDLYGSHP